MSEGQDDKWEMPDPVFRSSTGGLPKSFEETISTSFSPDKTGAIDDDDDILGIMDRPGVEHPVDDHPVPADPEEAADAEEDAIIETEPVRKSFWSFTTIFLLMVVAAAVVIGLFFFLSRTG